jgi:CBS domain-containing protein
VSPEESGWGSHTMPEKRIQDLMLDLGTLERISPQTRLAEAVKRLDEKRHSLCPPFLLVVDEVENKEEVLGMLSMDDVLGHMEPSTESMEELPIFWQGQFREECEVIIERPAAEIMSPVTRVIDQRGTLMEAVHLMNSVKIDWLPVVEGGEVVGILLKEDLFKEVLAATQPEASLSRDLQ